MGRSRTRKVGTGTAETLHYLGTGDAVVRIGGGSSPVDAAIDPAGTRLATRQSAGSPSFLLPDLHGNVAALWDQSTSAYGATFRYDPYGELLSSPPGGSTRTPWRYQGRMLEGEAGDAELYDFGFRSYAADLGAFASLDSVKGGATDVISLNRFLYANADPTTLIDPTGHCAMYASDGGLDPMGTGGNCVAATAGLGVGLAESGVGVGVGIAAGIGSLKDAALCGLNPFCWGDAADSGREVVAAVEQTARTVAADPEAAVRGAVSTAALGAADWIGQRHRALTTTGGFEGGREAGRVGGGIWFGGMSMVVGPAAAARTVSAAPGVGRAFAGGLDLIADMPRTAVLKGLQAYGRWEVDRALRQPLDEAQASLRARGVSPAETRLAQAGVPRFYGTAVDVAVKSRVVQWKVDRVLGIKYTGRGVAGPDFYNPRTRTAWYITTRRSLDAHRTRYLVARAGRMAYARLSGLTYR